VRILLDFQGKNEVLLGDLPGLPSASPGTYAG